MWVDTLHGFLWCGDKCCRSTVKGLCAYVGTELQLQVGHRKEYAAVSQQQAHVGVKWEYRLLTASDFAGIVLRDNQYWVNLALFGPVPGFLKRRRIAGHTYILRGVNHAYEFAWLGSAAVVDNCHRQVGDDFRIVDKRVGDRIEQWQSYEKQHYPFVAPYEPVAVEERAVKCRPPLSDMWKYAWHVCIRVCILDDMRSVSASTAL